MTVKLTIRENGGRPREVLLPSRGVLNAPLTVRVSNDISAEIVLEEGDPGGHYMLQVGNNPDIRAHVDVYERSVSRLFTWSHYSTDLREFIHETSFRLFRGTMGTSLLYISCADGVRTAVPLCEVTVLLDGTDVRGDYYDEMVRYLLKNNLPHFVLNDFLWQMSRNRFSVGWKDGYSSTEDPGVMLRILGKVVKEMIPLVRSVALSAQMAFIRRRRRRILSQVTRVDSHLIRDAESVMRRSGVGELEDVSEAFVSETSRAATFETAAHAVICTFMRGFVLRRLEIIQRLLENKINQKKKSVDGFLANSNQGTKILNQLADEKAYLESLNRKKGVVNSLIRIVRGMLSLPIFAGVRDDLTVFDIEDDVFSGNEAYRRLYKIMLDYWRTRFWWIGDLDNARWRLPKIELSRDAEKGETRLQFKYSVVYENWAYARLVLAMIASGYEIEKTLSEGVGVSGRVIFRNGTTHLTIVHGFTAWMKKKDKTSEFEYVGGRANKKTPDFAIIVQSDEFDDFAWFVCDAKSDAALKRHMVDVRTEYATTLRRLGKSPLASVLIWSGESNSGPASVECPPPALKTEVPNQVSADDEDGFNDHSGDDYVWRSDAGVIEGEHDAAPYHLHVRANVDSVERSSDVFAEFLQGMIATALRAIAAGQSGAL